MAAPTTSYLNNANDKITLETTDANENLLSTYDSLIASYIYGTADIKALFYLDAVYEVEVMASDETTVVRKGFIGVVENNPSSFNYKHHKASRFFHVQFDTTTSAEVFVKNWIAFSDAGLNTLGDADKDSESIKFHGLEVTISGKSSYYLPTTIVGVEWKLTSSGTWTNTVQDSTGISQALSFQKVFTLIDKIAPGASIDIRAFITNDEGTYRSASYTITIGRPNELMGFGGTSSAAYADLTDTPVRVYIDTMGIDVGTKMYLANGNPVSAGYYATADLWYKVELNGLLEAVVTDFGNVGNWDEGGPAEFVARSFRMKHSNQFTGCSIMTAGDPTLTIYRHVATGKYYETASTTGTLVNGFYYDGTTADNGAFVYYNFSSGVEVGMGDCTNGLYL